MRSSCPRHGLLPAALLLLLLGGAARAEPPRETVAILSVELRGATDSKSELARAVRDAFAEHMDLATTQRIADALRGEPDPGCMAGPCAQRIAAATSARWLVRARAESLSSDYDLEVDLTDGRTGKALPPLKDRCTLCGWSEVGVRLSALARGAVSLAAAQSQAPVAPPQVVSPTPIPKRSAGLAAGKWITAALAVGLLATAGVMFGFDGQGTCSLPAADAGLRCPRHYATALEGGVFLAGGALAGAASGVLFWLDYQHTRVTPSVTVAPGAASLGVSGEF